MFNISNKSHLLDELLFVFDDVMHIKVLPETNTGIPLAMKMSVKNKVYMRGRLFSH